VRCDTVPLGGMHDCSDQIARVPPAGTTVWSGCPDAWSGEVMTTGWGPDGKRAAVSFAFDNLGEASDIQFGRWPVERAVGGHHSVTRDLPLLLEALRGHELAFFIEAWNLPVYPGAIEAIAEAGHEIGSHAVRHEIWCTLTRDQELDHMRQCVDDFARHGVEIKGLRPPGAIAAPSSAEVLPSLGLTYISPLGVKTGVLDTGIAILGSEPAASDVAFYSPAFVSYRAHKPSTEVLGPEDFVEGMMAEVEKVVESGSYLSTTCHPFMQSPSPDATDPARIEAIAEVVTRIASDDRIWAAQPRTVAEWMLAHPDDYPGPPNLDPPDYWNPSFYQDITRD
jgi:peptidoglycan/xylan/chitin deacetylase (PgdA/CDA1 family)